MLSPLVIALSQSCSSPFYFETNGFAINFWGNSLIYFPKFFDNDRINDNLTQTEAECKVYYSTYDVHLLAIRSWLSNSRSG